ncbi:putative sugar nucleotidyl transferase [Mucilaginibacter antarcticus]|uniref:putative sugar nucleotidyl transferase n=1 Tax=Mucilaginibacter antarcticus TaxID=1855725 RepID=UPI00363EBDFB
MAIILFDDSAHLSLLPLTYTRPVADLRIGILTIAEKWARHLDTTFSFQTQPHLQTKFALKKGVDDLYINGSVCPDEGLTEAITQLKTGEALKQGDFLIAAKADPAADFTTIVDYSPFLTASNIPKIFLARTILSCAAILR